MKKFFLLIFSLVFLLHLFGCTSISNYDGYEYYINYDDFMAGNDPYYAVITDISVYDEQNKDFIAQLASSNDKLEIRVLANGCINVPSEQNHRQKHGKTYIGNFGYGYENSYWYQYKFNLEDDWGVGSNTGVVHINDLKNAKYIYYRELVDTKLNGGGASHYEVVYKVNVSNVSKVYEQLRKMNKQPSKYIKYFNKNF